MPDGSERLGVTQLVTYKQLGAIHNGAAFYRVAFRFADIDASPDSQFDQDVDTAWCIVDHKNCNIVFGPVEGIKVRHPGLGIGSYLLGQLIRLVQPGELRGNYQVQSIHLPLEAQTHVNEADASANDARIETVLSRAGFYVSTAGGSTVAGVRRTQDLRPWWNQEKVRFLSFPQFLDLAAQWHREKKQSEKALDVAEQIVAGANQRAEHLQTQLTELTGQSSSEVASLNARITELQGELQSRAEEHDSSFASQSQQHRLEVQQLEERIAELNRDAKSRAASTPSPAPTVESRQQTLTLDLSPSVVKLLWAGLGMIGLCVAITQLGQMLGR